MNPDIETHIAAVQESDAPFIDRYEPDSPFADADGMVRYPNVNTVIEQIVLSKQFRYRQDR